MSERPRDGAEATGGVGGTGANGRIRVTGRKETAGRTVHDRRAVLRTGLAAGVAAAGSRIWSPRGGAAQDATPASPGASPSAGYLPSPAEGVPDAYTVPPEPYQSYDGVPGNGGTVRTFSIAYNPAPPAREENQYWQELERRLGVTWEPNLTPQPTFGEVSAVLIGGGDLPDLFYLNPEQNALPQYQAMEQGAFTDLTDYLTGDALQEYRNLSTFPEYMWRNVRFNGRLYGVPRPIQRNGNIAFYRGDWARAIGMGAPESADQVHDLLVGFAKNDPDGDGQADTWGMGQYGGGWDNELIALMFGSPNGWRLNDDGTLVNAIETEEYRRVLGFMRQLFADGAYHPDSAGMNFRQAVDNFKGGITGLHSEGFGSFFGRTGMRGVIPTTNLGAEVVGLVPFGHEGRPGVTHNTRGFFGFTAIPASVGGDEERVRELLRILDYLAAPFGSEEANFLGNGIEGVHHELREDGARIVNDRGTLERSDLVYLMAGLPVYFFPDVPGEAELAQRLATEIVEIGLDNPTWGLYSPASAESGSVINELLIDRRTAVVTGRDPLESWDQVLEEWRSRGGDQIREQFQEALAAQ